MVREKHTEETRKAHPPAESEKSGHKALDGGHLLSDPKHKALDEKLKKQSAGAHLPTLHVDTHKAESAKSLKAEVHPTAHPSAAETQKAGSAKSLKAEVHPATHPSAADTHKAVSAKSLKAEVHPTAHSPAAETQKAGSAKSLKAEVHPTAHPSAADTTKAGSAKSLKAEVHPTAHSPVTDTSKAVPAKNLKTEVHPAAHSPIADTQKTGPAKSLKTEVHPAAHSPIADTQKTGPAKNPKAEIHPTAHSPATDTHKAGSAKSLKAEVHPTAHSLVADTTKAVPAKSLKAEGKATADEGRLNTKPAELPKQQPKPTETRLPNIQDMIDQTKEWQGRIGHEKTMPKFDVREISEFAFKARYAKEAVRLGSEHNLSAADMKKFVLGHYSIEGLGKIPSDMQAGTPFKLALPDQPGETANRDARRNHPAPLSTGIGYNQIIFPTNLHLIHDDDGSVAERLRTLGLNRKARLYENLQDRLHAELMNFAKQDPEKESTYLYANQTFSWKLYSDFAKSKTPGLHGLTGRQFTSGLHTMLIDGDIGPILQARQLKEDIDQVYSPEFKEYLKNKQKAEEKPSNYYEQFVQVLKQWVSEALGLEEDKHQPDNPATAKAAPAATELCNMLGKRRCRQMFKNPEAPITQFVTGRAYQTNSILHDVKNTHELLDKFLKQMKQKGPGTIEFESVFKEMEEK